MQTHISTVPFKDYKLSKSGNHFYAESTTTVNEEGFPVITEHKPIKVTPELKKLWMKLRGA